MRGVEEARRECLDRERWRLLRWRDKVKEYMRERGECGVRRVEEARRECLDRERWRLFCRGHTLRGRSWRERGIRER